MDVWYILGAMNKSCLRNLNIETHSLSITDNKAKLLVSCHVTRKPAVAVLGIRGVNLRGLIIRSPTAPCQMLPGRPVGEEPLNHGHGMPLSLHHRATQGYGSHYTGFFLSSQHLGVGGGGPAVQSQPELQRELLTSLGYVRPCVRDKIK